MVGKEVSLIVKPRVPSNIVSSQVSYFAWKMHNLQTIEITKKGKK